MLTVTNAQVKQTYALQTSPLTDDPSALDFKRCPVPSSQRLAHKRNSCIDVSLTER
jgi:hypothetical protein